MTADEQEGLLQDLLAAEDVKDVVEEETKEEDLEDFVSRRK